MTAELLVEFIDVNGEGLRTRIFTDNIIYRIYSAHYLIWARIAPLPFWGSPFVPVRGVNPDQVTRLKTLWPRLVVVVTFGPLSGAT